MGAYGSRSEPSASADHWACLRRAHGTDLLDLEPAYAEGRELFASTLTFSEMTRRFDAGAAIVSRRSGDAGNGNGNGAGSEPSTLLFVISATGQLRVATAGDARSPSEGDTTVWLGSGRAPEGHESLASGRVALISRRSEECRRPADGTLISPGSEDAGCRQTTCTGRWSRPTITNPGPTAETIRSIKEIPT